LDTVTCSVRVEWLHAYKFIVDIKSAEYLGTDTKTELTAIIVDSESSEWEVDEEEDDEGDDEEVDVEAKKEK